MNLLYFHKRRRMYFVIYFLYILSQQRRIILLNSFLNVKINLKYNIVRLFKNLILLENEEMHKEHFFRNILISPLKPNLHYIRFHASECTFFPRSTFPSYRHIIDLNGITLLPLLYTYY